MKETLEQIVYLPQRVEEGTETVDEDLKVTDKWEEVNENQDKKDEFAEEYNEDAAEKPSRN